ncbi:MAG: hypothetical protein CV087_18830 [Candidatus Brocadia sp. WS118]|nr:MAG: hypothetical protein CV087_18830 [Candidatus Brocadia sp. WS118]
MQRDTIYTYKHIHDAWDEAADAIEIDIMRPVRYAKCFRYLRDIPHDSKLLEVGCGQGTGLLIARGFGFKNLVGVDVSEERLRRAKDKLQGHASLTLVPIDTHLPFKDEYFDVVISAAVIEHTLKPKVFMQEISRVVKKGGCVIIESDCYQWRILQLLGIYKSVQPIDKAMFPTQLFKIFKDNGFQLVHYEGFPIPGRGFQFIKMIYQFTLEQPIIRWIASAKRQGVRILKNLLKRVFISSKQVHTISHPPDMKVNQKSPLYDTETLNNIVKESWTSKYKLWSFFKLVFSNENVFFLIKQDGLHQRGS